MVVSYLLKTQGQHQSSSKYGLHFKIVKLQQTSECFWRSTLLFPASFNLNFSQLTLLLCAAVSVPLFPPPIPAFSPHLLMSTNTFLFSRASQGLCEITYFTDPLSSATLPAHQTADLLTLSRPLPLRTFVSVSCFCLFTLTSRSKVKMQEHKNKRWVLGKGWDTDVM